MAWAAKPIARWVGGRAGRSRWSGHGRRARVRSGAGQVCRGTRGRPDTQRRCRSKKRVDERVDLFPPRRASWRVGDRWRLGERGEGKGGQLGAGWARPCPSRITLVEAVVPRSPAPFRASVRYVLQALSWLTAPPRAERGAPRADGGGQAASAASAQSLAGERPARRWGERMSVSILRRLLRSGWSAIDLHLAPERGCRRGEPDEVWVRSRARARRSQAAGGACRSLPPLIRIWLDGGLRERTVVGGTCEVG